MYEEIFLFFMLLGGLIGFCLTIIWNFIQKKRWPYDVTIFEKRDNGYWVIQDKARKFTDNSGRQFFRLKKEKKNIKPIKYEDILLSGKRGYMQVYSPNRDEMFATQFSLTAFSDEERIKLEKELAELCIPVGFSENFQKGQLEVIPDDMKFWHINERKAAFDRWIEPKPWYFEPMFVGLMAIVATGMMIAIILYMTTQNMAGISGGLSATAQSLNDLLTQLVEKGIHVTAEAADTVANAPGRTGGLPPP